MPRSRCAWDPAHRCSPIRYTAPSRTSARFKSMHARTSTHTWALAHAPEHRHGLARTGTLLITHSTQHRGVLYSTSRRAPTHTSIAIAFTGHPTVAATSSSTHNAQSRPLTTAHTHRHHAHAHSASAHTPSKGSCKRDGDSDDPAACVPERRRRRSASAHWSPFAPRRPNLL